MRSYRIAGNWKMNTTTSSARSLATAILQGISTQQIHKNVQVDVFPPFVNIESVMDILHDSPVHVGSQNCSDQPYGAFTGEVSTDMLEAIGCTSVIIGHSERRQHFHEADALIHDKLRQVLKSSLSPILCIGETLKQRQENKTLAVLRDQINSALDGQDPSNVKKLVIAYEPVWAIGTGVAASADEAEQAHSFIRSHISSLDFKTELSVPLLYGGSVTDDNATALLSQPNIDGALIGGASLKADVFVRIIQQASRLCID